MFKAIASSVYIIFSGIFGIPANTHVQNIPVSTNTVNTKLQATSTKVVSSKISTNAGSAKKPVVAKKIATPTPEKSNASQKTNTPIIQNQTEETIPFETINVNTRKAVVNILCSTKNGGSLSPITGSGVMIGGNGVVLTNAHIAQYLLLKDFNNQKDFVDCVIRTGNPAYSSYKTELIYISPAWIINNKSVLVEQNPKGTGEHDYAFLRITSKLDSSEIGVVPYLQISLAEDNVIGLNTLLASYPAGFLGGQSILQNLYQSSSIVNISSVFTFGTSTIDLISIGGSVVSQKGSSGGAVVNNKGELIGIISTESEAAKTSDRDLRAITMSYINRDLITESGSSIVDILTYPKEYASDFNEKIAPKLTEILTNAVLKK